MMKTVIVNIFGRVQGVGFRHFALKTALAHEMVGRVKNELDGSVTIKATGYQEEIDVFLRAIEIGNGFSKVDCMSIEEGPPVLYRDFKVEY